MTDIPDRHEPALSRRKIVARVAETIGDISAEVWDRLGGQTAEPSHRSPNPFLRHSFLKALEDSGCVGEQSGWYPQYLCLEVDGALSGVVPAYLKAHSQGEYVFDHSWADALERAGMAYYPKLQVAVPFTPVTGPRLLTDSGDPVIREGLAQSVRAYVQQADLSSAHATFLDTADLETFARNGFSIRHDIQYHFINRDYNSYEDFLASLSSRKRKSLRKERGEALRNGIEVEWLSGSTLTEEAWDAMFRFYMDTGSRKWGRPYLNRAFFQMIGDTMANDVLLVMAKREGRYIAGALNFIGSDRLFGRYWGCIEDHPYLHFELCYHQAIDYALQHGLAVVEAGAQGEHKLARGYEPVLTSSAHYLHHPGLRRAVDDYLAKERPRIIADQAALMAETPFRKEETPQERR